MRRKQEMHTNSDWKASSEDIIWEITVNVGSNVKMDQRDAE
jgi:hypothetical protein